MQLIRKQVYQAILIMPVFIERTARRKIYVEQNVRENQPIPADYAVTAIQAALILKKKSVQL